MNNQKTAWASTVRELFQLIEDADVALRPAMAPYDGLVAGTIVMIVHRNSDRIEEIFSSCDYEAFTSLVRDYQRRVNSHVVRRDHLFMYVLNKEAWNKRLMSDKVTTNLAMTG